MAPSYKKDITKKLNGKAPIEEAPAVDEDDEEADGDQASLEP
jgi:hypothetical protein